MRKEYIDHFVRNRLKHMIAELPDLFIKAAQHKDGEKEGLAELAQRLNIPPPHPKCCVVCGTVCADFALPGMKAEWCCMHKPEGAIYSVSKLVQRERYQMCKDNARFLKYEKD